jgi:hypothetical protein
MLSGEVCPRSDLIDRAATKVAYGPAVKAWIAGALLVAMVGTASADDDDLAPRHFNYRRDLILADSLSFGLLGAGIAAGTWMFEPDDFHLPLMIGAYGFGGVVLAAPVIHMSRGNLGRGALSLGLRVLTPSVMGAVIATASGTDDPDATYMFGGMVLGAGIAAVLDCWLLVPEGPSRPSEKPPTAPMITPVAGGAIGGIAGYW